MCSLLKYVVKTLTRIVKYESQVIREYSTYGSYGGTTLKLVDFEDLDTASKGYKNSKSENFEKFLKILRNFSKFVLIFEKIFKTSGNAYPLAVGF